MAMPLPMPSLPPVIRAVLPLSCSSILGLPFALFTQILVVRAFVVHPRPVRRDGEEIAQRRVDNIRFFHRDRVSGSRYDLQSRRWYRTFEEQTAVQARMILVTDHYQQRRRELPQRHFHVPQGGAVALQVQHS